MDWIIVYIVVGYFWALIALNRTVELKYKMSIKNMIICGLLNFTLWPICIPQAVRFENKVIKEKSRWVS